MQEDCFRCLGTGEIIVNNSYRKQNGEIYLAGELETCPDCGGSGKIFVIWED